MKPRYVVVTPVRDEVLYIEKTIEAVGRQTILPAEWIIVDDGSTDGTGELLDRRAGEHGCIKVIHRGNRGFRSAGGGVMEAFYAGYSQISDSNWDFIVKLDGDVEAVFIRAPIIRKTGPGVNVIKSYNGTAVLAEQGRHMVATFHPELTADSGVHELFLNKIG